MASKSQHIKAIVLKKIKLSETDLIVTLLKEDGSQVRAVAKGARKPSSTFSSRLELFSNVRLLIAEGKNLDIIREAKLIKSYSALKSDIEKIVCASPALELLEKVTQQNLVSEQLYPLTISFLDEVEKMDATYYLKGLCAAVLLKICSFVGYRPCLSSCVICGDKMEDNLQDIDVPLNFSFDDGGLVCLRCSRKSETIKISARNVKLIHEFIHAKFEDIKLMTIHEQSIDAILEFCKKWILYHIGARMKSLDFYIENT